MSKSPWRTYGKWFYAATQDGSVRSAERVLPSVMDLVRPSSLVDIGCGSGAWLSVAKGLGIDRLVGIDGEWVSKDALLIPEESFRKWDLSRALPQGSPRFDLAMSVEVAEHLDPGRADSFVADLCALSDVVLFSAAVPGQTGSDHRNEQWPMYWRDRFQQHGYELIDCLRTRMWADEEVEPWYAQNSYLYVSADRLAADSRLSQAAAEGRQMPLCVIHPRLFNNFSKPYAPAVPAPAERRPAPQQFLPRMEPLP
ncbi:class I SAM-dependent methyltransferase [Streptomyces antnestii]|nr:class I SAM-dependent methyltransferase [Streptomyces sp. San01]